MKKYDELKDVCVLDEEGECIVDGEYILECISSIDELTRELFQYYEVPRYIREFDDNGGYELILEEYLDDYDLENFKANLEILEDDFLIYYALYKDKLGEDYNCFLDTIFIPERVNKENLEDFFDRSYRNEELILNYCYDDALTSDYSSYERYCKKSVIEEILKKTKEYSDKETNLVGISNNDRFLFTNVGLLIDLKEIYEKVRER